MRKLIALISIFLFLTASSAMEQSIDPITLFQQVHTGLDEHADKMEWNVLMKEQITPEKMQELVNEQKNRTLVTGKRDGNDVKYTMGLIKEGNMSATMTITHYEQYGQAEVIVEINGTKWSEEIEEQYDAVVTDIQRTYFSRKARVFACLKATYNATIYRNEIIDKMQKTLQLQHISELTDPLTDPNDQQIWYGYTPRLTQTLTIDNNNTNVQIVVNTKEDDEFTVIIGTPIIIHEY